LKILATYNLKGGVGKTAAAVNLAYLSARDGYRTLVWDLDPQAAATFYFRIRPRVRGGGRGLVRGRQALDAAIKGTDFENLDLLPADFSYRKMDFALSHLKKPAHTLLRLIRPLAQEYDFLFLDCAPSISLVSENVFHAADALLVPIIPTTLSIRTYDQVREFMARANLMHATLLPFFSMVESVNLLHQETMEVLTRERPGVLRSQIPHATQVERMGVHRAPLGSYAGRSRPALAYEGLWEEIKTRL